MRCENCNEENDAGNRFCRRCGAPTGAGRWRVPLILLGGAASLCVAVFVFMAMRPASTDGPSPPVAVPSVAPAAVPATLPPSAEPVTVGIAYGTEKQDWLTWAAAEFAKTDAARGVRIDLKPMGSVEAAHAIVRGDKGIQVWSPASALYKEAFVRDWKAGHNGAEPIAREAPLALTPMVFVTWDARYDAFTKHYGEMNFRTIGQALGEKGGWATIANQPDWMFFKFSHTDPATSNSGLMSLVLMGYDHAGKHAGLDGRDITDPAFQEWLRSIERSLTGAASGLTSSTGYLMTSMVQRGWSTYDVILVYESVAIERLKAANGRWGPLRVVYPRVNMWNDNPYYVLDVPWSTPAQRAAANAFLEFLLSEGAQREAMAHGFRPANVAVPTNGPDSPFVAYGSIGFRADVPGAFCEPPKAEVIENLLLAWERSQGGAR